MRTVRKMLLQSPHDKEPVECMVECDIDMDALLQRMGNVAWRNKRRRSRAMHGVIDVRVRESLASQEKKDE
jgi:hypothetical protein